MGAFRYEIPLLIQEYFCCVAAILDIIRRDCLSFKGVKMDKPLTIWYCDVCGKPITSPREGYVIWQSKPDEKYKDFKIIHQRICDDKSYHASSALEDFLGDKGLGTLLSFLSAGSILVDDGIKGAIRVSDLDDFVDFMRRVQTPYYEEARKYFSNSRLQDDFHGSNEAAPYNPSTLESIIKEYGS